MRRLLPNPLTRIAVLTGMLVGVITYGALTSSADPSVPAFSATFDTPADFYGRFDYALSGGTIAGRGDPNTAALESADETPHYMGDHDVNCGGPTTQRPVYVSGETWTNANQFPVIDFSPLFWWCAPGGDPANGHMMTGLDTLGYNHLWFSPKDEYAGITKVCWDINETTEGGKWTEVQFVDHADATRYPAGTHLTGQNIAPSTARGTGGFDLGYTKPDFRPQYTGGNSAVGPNTGLQPQSGNLAGLVVDSGSIFEWFQNQDTVTAQGVGWPGVGGIANGNGTPTIVTDKATRYQTCIENANSTQIRITNARPDGVFTYMIPGQIPQDSRRVVFHDAEYDGPKRNYYDPNALTWHWDNVQVFTATGGPAPTTTTTAAPTTTVLPTTTTISSTTTLPPTTTTTVAPTTTTSPACPPDFSAAQTSWCVKVNARLHALDGG